jgi:predicted RNA-binding Zn-ribbon protein involved in translation (DUF1610 family)
MAAGARPDGVALAWARDRRGLLTPATALDPASRRERAPFTCPGCGDELVVRLGSIRARHFAHRPGSACPLTAPETALHFNAKRRLLALCEEAFSGAGRVTLLIRCPACRRPDPRELAGLGDSAEEEGVVGAHRADVLVSRAGLPTLAVEVLVTHAVGDAKGAALGLAGVPVVEIDAREAWERETSEGGREVVCARALGFPPCATCRTLARAEADRSGGDEAAQIAELESYRARGLIRGDVLDPPNDAPSRRVKSPSRRRIPGPNPEYPSPGAPPAPPYPEYLGPQARRPPPIHDADTPLTPEERDALTARFACPDCGGKLLWVGTRLVLHSCPGHGARPVAWRGYDGRLATLGWWKR